MNCGNLVPSRDIYNVTPVPKAQKTFREKEQKDLERQRTRKSAVKLHLLEMAAGIRS